MEPRTEFLVSTPPHLKAAEDTSDIMRWVCIALGPAFGVGLYVFGWYAILITLISVASCVITEAICQKLRGHPVSIKDFSAVLSGLLLAAVLPPNVSWWIPVVGGVFAMAIVKHAFGGLGSNIWNPALAARAFLQVSFSTQINSPHWAMIRDKGQGLMQRLGYTLNGSFADYAQYANMEFKDQLPLTIGGAKHVAAELVKPDVVSMATPLAQLKDLSASPEVVNAGTTASHILDISQAGHYKELVWNSFIGIEPGCIAEVSALALLVGGLFLLFKKIITWEAPVFYLGTIALLTWVLPAKVAIGGETAYTTWFSGPMLLQLFAGGAFLGAFFMDTDYVTTPMSRKGKIIFAVGAGIITAMIRLYSSAYPEGCCYSILLMNTCVPLIDSWTRPKKFGLKKPAPTK